MDPTGGYIRLHRKILQNPIWTQLVPAVLKVALYFMLRANYKPTQWYDGSRSVPVPVGSFITSYASTAAACNLSVQQVRDAFDHLERTQFATYKRTHRWTLVSVVNYESYQAIAKGENSRENTSGNRQGTPDKEIKKITKNECASKNDARVDSLPHLNDPLVGTPEPDGLPPEDRTPAKRYGRSDLASQQDAWFAEWWASYWLRKDRKKALRSFRKQIHTEAFFQQVMKATRAQAPEMLTREPKHRPYGATWLSGERWEDETTNTPAAAQDDYPEFPK